MDDVSRDARSPLLEYEQVRELLIEANRQAGGRGASAAPGPGGRRLSVAAGRAGGDIGARLFTRMWGGARLIPVPDRTAAIRAVRAIAADELFCDDRSAAGERMHVAQALIVGTGGLNMNTAVVQLQWSTGEVLATAHALEGVIKQRSVTKALDRIEEAILGLPS